MNKQPEVISDWDWNFDHVPDGELVACCYWEYARESAFILRVRQRCLDPRWNNRLNSELWEYCGRDLEKIQSIGWESEVFLRGFVGPPDEVLSDAPPLQPGEVHPAAGRFPKPWQALPAAERRARSHLGTERIPRVPFQRGTSSDAQDILDWVKTQRANSDAEPAQVRRENPKLNEETLLHLGKLKFPAVKPSVSSAGGREVTVVAIDWGSFTNDQIVNHFRRWVKANRPSPFPVPSRQGHKPGDWRANLTRLAVLRLLSRFSALQIVRQNILPAVWETKQFSGHKWGDFTKWRDARREAGKLFRRLFPFLPQDEKPISWARPAPGQ